MCQCVNTAQCQHNNKQPVTWSETASKVTLASVTHASGAGLPQFHHKMKSKNVNIVNYTC